MIAALSTPVFVRPARATAPPAPEDPNPWPALERGIALARTASTNGTGALAPALEQALQRFDKAKCTFHTDSFKPDPVLPQEAIMKILEGSTVKVAFSSGAMAKLKGMADLRVLDGLVGLGPQVLDQDEKDFLQVWDSLGSRGFKPRHYGSDPQDPRADKLEALQNLRTGSTISLETPGNGTCSAKTLDELKAMDFISGGPEWPVADLEKARTLRSAQDRGLIFYSYSSPKNAYEAYKSSDPTLSVSRAGSPRLTLTLEQLKDAQGTDQLFQQASEFHQQRLGKLYEQLKVTDNPPQIPTAWVDMRRRFSPEVADAAACELLQAAVIGGQQNWYNVEKVWGLAAKVGEFARDDYQLACLAKGIAPLLENGKQEDADRALMRLVNFEKERELTDEEQTTMLTLVNGTRSISAAQEGMDLVRIPLSDETLEQREQVFLNLGRSLAPAENHRTAEFYRTVLAEKLPDENLGRTGDRLGRIYHACAAENRANQALSAFRSIQRKLRAQPHTPEEADKVVQKFLNALLLGRDTKSAIASLDDPTQGASVAQGERHVVIGGIRVPRKKAAAAG